MGPITQAQVDAVLAAHASNSFITPAQVQQQLGNASVTFAQLLYATTVQTAAKHKSEDLTKITYGNVMLSATLKAHTDVYARKVRKTAAAIASNDPAAVAAFVAGDNWFEHTECFCLVQHKEHTHKKYLYAIYNNAVSAFTHNGKLVTREHVGQFLTPSGLRELMKNEREVFNKTHNIVHSVHVRVVALDNIVGINARKQLLTV